MKRGRSLPSKLNVRNESKKSGFECYFNIYFDFLKIAATQRDDIAPEIIGYPKDVYIDEGESVIFTCQVAGYPDPRVAFYRNGKKLTSNENVLVGKHKF